MVKISSANKILKGEKIFLWAKNTFTYLVKVMQAWENFLVVKVQTLLKWQKLVFQFHKDSQSQQKLVRNTMKTADKSTVQFKLKSWKTLQKWKQSQERNLAIKKILCLFQLDLVLEHQCQEWWTQSWTLVLTKKLLKLYHVRVTIHVGLGTVTEDLSKCSLT